MTRAEILAEARSWIGTPWLHQASCKGVGADCIGFGAGVAAALSMDQGHYTKIENGASTSAATAAKIAAYFAPAISELHVLYPERFPRDEKAEAA
jgi:hypothetical protein